MYVGEIASFMQEMHPCFWFFFQYRGVLSHIFFSNYNEFGRKKIQKISLNQLDILNMCLYIMAGNNFRRYILL